MRTIGKLATIIITASILLAACGDVTKPVYWTCSGNHTQWVENQSGKVLEKYEGRQNLLIEIYRGAVSQFNAPAAFGVYKLCLDTKEKIVFSTPKCEEHQLGVGDDDSYIRYGLIDKQTGELT